MMSAYRKLYNLLDKKERRQLLRLLAMLIVMVILEW